MPTTVLWFRRDLRLHDNPALLEAARDGDVLPLFVIDPSLWKPSGSVRQAYLLRSLRSLDHDLRDRGGRLLLRSGDPTSVLPAVVAEHGAKAVHVAADFGPYGRRRDEDVGRALEDEACELVSTGSPYAVAPGRVRKDDGSPYRVYSPFYRAWSAHGWRPPADEATDVAFVRVAGSASDAWPDEPDVDGVTLPDVGEQAARERWERFRDDALDAYGARRNRPDLAATSQLSAALRWGEIHPRTLLAALGRSRGHEVFRKELAWREFYAHVLFHAPHSAREYLKPEMALMEQDRGRIAEERTQAWAEGCTGYPFVDAGMRQMRTEGWIHNRVRMVVASFLVKDLHIDWRIGAREFMRWLRDGDLASNQHGWQWVAGSGTDAAPYFRVFNPVMQGQKFDPDGDYVRRYVAELRDVAGPAVHEPWDLPGGLPGGYPERIVDHREERAESLRRYSAVTKDSD